MKKYLLSLGVIIAATLSLTSCLGSSTSDQKYTFNYGPNDCFNRVVDTHTGEAYIGLNPTYKFEFNMSTQKLNFEMSNLKLTSGYQGLSFRFPEMNFGVDQNDGFFTASGSNITPVGLTSAYVFDDFSLRAYPFRNPGVYVMDFMIENRYKVTTFPVCPLYLGSIYATNQEPKEGEDAQFEIINDADTYYQILINPEKMTAMLAVAYAKYSKDMTRYSFAARELPIELNETGFSITTEADKKFDLYDPSTVTSENAKPIEGCSISNIRVAATLRTGASVTFDCDLGNYGKYSVRAILRYLFYNDDKTEK